MSSGLPFLLVLAEWLNRGILQLPRTQIQLHREFILSKQIDCGGFVNRFGEEDLYYSSFAVRGLQLLGDIPKTCSSRIVDYMQRFVPTELSTIDLLNWVQMSLALQLLTGNSMESSQLIELKVGILKLLDANRSSDGGYAKSPQGTMGSTYHSFLTLLVFELLNEPLPDPAGLVRFLRNQQRDDGGFVEIAPVKLSGTNPTAAAVVALKQLGALNSHDASDVGGFLDDVWNMEGGYAANTRIPFPDALSTFTALITNKVLNISQPERHIKIQNLLSTQLEFPSGGFRAAMWDEQADLEYTFYGLGTLALIAN